MRGVVTDADTGAGLAGAEVEVEDRAEKVVTSSARGEFWRLPLPGSYTLRSDSCSARFERSMIISASYTMQICRFSINWMAK